MSTELGFAALVIALVLQRLYELRLSHRNEKRLRARGAVEHAPGHFRAMAALHAAWFVAMLAEVFWLEPPFSPAVCAVALLLAALGQALRYAAIRTLGERWTVRILTLPGDDPVRHGIYRYVRHPNYAGVVLELAAVPLVHGAIVTSVAFSIANALVLWVRIREEERALRSGPGYGPMLAKPRFLPRSHRDAPR